MLVFILQLASLAVEAPPVGADDCVSRTSDEVVICGSRRGQSPYRLPRLPERYDAAQIRAEADLIPGVHGRAHVDSVGMPDGYRSNRVMVTISTGF